MMESLLHCQRCLWHQLSHHKVVGTSMRWLSSGKQCHYEALGLKPDASPVEIKEAFLELSKKHHPDVNAKDPKSHDKFVSINQAYTVLNKASSRREYDENILSRRRHEHAARHTVYEYDPERRQYNTKFHQNYHQQEYDPLEEDIKYWRQRVEQRNFSGSRKPDTIFTRNEKLKTIKLILGFALIVNILQFALASLSYKWNQEYSREQTNKLSKLLKDAELRGQDPDYHSEFKRKAMELALKEQTRIRALKERRNAKVNTKVDTEELTL